MLKNLKDGGTFLLNTEFSKEEIIDYLPNRVKKQLACLLYTSAGSMDRVKAPQIVNFFVSKAGVRKEDIGDIDIKRKFTFVDINKKVINKVVDKCNKQKINNRKIEIEIANKK